MSSTKLADIYLKDEVVQKVTYTNADDTATDLIGTITVDGEPSQIKAKLGTDITVEQTVTSGIEIAKITVNNDPKYIYSPIAETVTSTEANPVRGYAVYNAVNDAVNAEKTRAETAEGELTQNIATNTQNIATNTQNIATNTQNIATNAQAIEVETDAREEADTKITDTVNSLSNNFDVDYDKFGNHYVYLKYGGTKVGKGFDANDFIKDGMISSVTKDTANHTITINWNTDAGITPIVINVAELVPVYDGDNTTIQKDGTKFSVNTDNIASCNWVTDKLADYYTKAQIDGCLTALTGYTDANEIHISAIADAMFNLSRLGIPEDAE